MNIYKALEKEYPDYKRPPNKGGLLTPWADRGVLLINTCLTVRRGEANSHSGKGWEVLMQKAIDTVAKVRTNGVVFLAWGTPAQQRTKGIPVDKHLVLKSVHPSPLSAARGFVSFATRYVVSPVLTRCSLTPVISESVMHGWSNVMAKTVALIGTSMSMPKRLSRSYLVVVFELLGVLDLAYGVP
jgi:uracil DNA glycosylase